jgi:uncharacterized membrane protein YfcA
MQVSRGVVAAWALAFGLFSGAVAGTFVSARTPAEELRHVAGFVVAFVPTIYLMITRRSGLWRRKHPFVRFVVFIVSSVVAIGGLTVTANLVFGGMSAGRVIEPLAALVGFAIVSWISFFGGAERLWDELLSRTDVEW